MTSFPRSCTSRRNGAKAQTLTFPHVIFRPLPFAGDATVHEWNTREILRDTTHTEHSKLYQSVNYIQGLVNLHSTTCQMHLQLAVSISVYNACCELRQLPACRWESTWGNSHQFASELNLAPFVVTVNEWTIKMLTIRFLPSCSCNGSTRNI